MKVLILGAGVIGSIFADLLHRGGNDVTILARGERFTTLQERGLVVQNRLTQETSFCRVGIASELCEKDEYDLIIVAVPKPSIPALLPSLERNTESPSILFMVNTADGYDDWSTAVGKGRLIIGFPGFGGTLTGPMVRYAPTPSWLQQTTIGEVDGEVSDRLVEIVSMLRMAGIPATYSLDMHAWQLTHLALVLPLSGAILRARSVHLLSLRDDLIKKTIEAILEAFRVLDALQIAVTPTRINIIRCVPRTMLRAFLKHLCRSEMFTTVTAHVSSAREELHQLGAEFRSLANKSGVPTPALDELMSQFQPLTPRAIAQAAA